MVQKIVKQKEFEPQEKHLQQITQQNILPLKVTTIHLFCFPTVWILLQLHLGHVNEN